MKFVKLYDVKNNIELKMINGNVILEIATDNTEDLLDINGQIYRLKKDGCKVLLQSPEDELLPSRALGTFTKEHINVAVPMNGNKVNMRAFKAKLNNLKGMMSHKEYVEIPEYEESDCISAFDYKVPKTDEDGNVITKTVEKTVYLDRVYTFSIYGKTVNHYGFIKGLAKSYKIPLATFINGKIIDPDDESYLLDDCNENVIELIKKKYKTITPEKKAMLLKFFGIHSKNIKISDFENFAYAMIHFKMFRVDGLPLPNKVDAEEFMNMLYMFKVPNAYDLVYDMAEKGMLVNLENYPELRQFEEARFYEDSYMEDEEDDDILD